MPEFDKKYIAKEKEKEIRGFWEKEDIFKFDKNTKKTIFSIDTPPPNISGKMHAGHAFSYSQTDFIARYKRMNGFEVFYPFGTDDNGLPTENLIQKEKKINLRQLTRKEAFGICSNFLKDYIPNAISDWKNLGLSCDFKNLNYSTIDNYSQKISQESFISLYKKGLIKRRKGPVMWDRKFQTAIAQAELEDVERKAFLNYVKAKIIGTQNTFLIYATTRPEMCFAVVGMSIENTGDYVKLKVGDEFYITGKQTYEEKFEKFNYELVEELKGENLIGEKVLIPIVEKEVEISHDEAVKADFGTGIAYFCTYGGQEDIEWAIRHKVEPINLINIYGKLSSIAGKYEGKLAEVARKEIIIDMEKEGSLIFKEEKTQIVNVGERSGVEVEFIVTNQWYVNYIDKKEYFWEMAEKFNWYPKFMKHRIENWIKGLNWDWGFSRQRHFGIPIPIWYCKNCKKQYLADSKTLPVDPTQDICPIKKCVCGSKDFIGESDVCDTWFTSASTPILASNLVGKSNKIKAIILDVDGVIIDSMKFKEECFNECLKKMNVNKNLVLDILELGLNRGLVFQKIKEKLKLDIDVQEYVDYFTKLQNDNFSNIRDIDNTFNFIKANYKNYLFFTNTSLPKKDLENLFKIKDLNKYFKELYSFDSGSKYENIERVLKEYDLKPNEVLFIDDNLNMINSVKNIGIKTVYFEDQDINIKEEILKIENKKNDLFNKIFPMDLRPQGHDIINTWLFYTMAKTNLEYNINPFKDVMISGYILASDGTKMSKSKKNGINPKDVVEKFSNDALRFAASGTKLGSDIPYQEKDVKTGFAVTNKIFNANKFASLLLNNFKKEDRIINIDNLNSIDKWILARLQNTIKNATLSFEKYDYATAKREFEIFFMKDIADNYIEIVKQRLWKPDIFGQEETLKAQKTLYYVLFNSLKGLAPILPFITEEVYQKFYRQFEDEKSIHLTNWPKVNKDFVSDELINLGNNFVEIVGQVRKFKSENQVSMKEELESLFIFCDKKTKEFIENSIKDLKAVTSAKKITFKDSKELKVEIKPLEN